MNYYPHHIGDYARDTAHLSMLEDGAYRRLLDLIYATEKPLPKEKEKVYRLARARSKEEKEAIDTVLGEFFSMTETGWMQNRALQEVLKAQEKSSKAADSAAKRWQCERNANAMRTHSEGNASAGSEGNAPNNQEPITNNQITTTTSAADDSKNRRQPTKPKISFDFSQAKFLNIEETDELRWQDAFPAVPIPPEIERAAVWLKANPANRKSNYEKFLVNWFSRAQDKAARVR